MSRPMREVQPKEVLTLEDGRRLLNYLSRHLPLLAELMTAAAMEEGARIARDAPETWREAWLREQGRLHHWLAHACIAWCSACGAEVLEWPDGLLQDWPERTVHRCDPRQIIREAAGGAADEPAGSGSSRRRVREPRATRKSRTSEVDL